jgi:prepilin-type N-terminal cleavage/methylation domain-containing protein
MHKKGFSLVELMIVLIVIGLLIGFIFPAAKKARDAALQRQCANNLNQIGAALILYAKDHNGAFPDPVGWWGGEDQSSRVFRDCLIADGYLPDNDKLFDCPASPTVGTADSPDYWYGNTVYEYDETGSPGPLNPDYPYTIYSPGWRMLCGCTNLGAPDYDGPHTKGTNYVNIAGRVYWEADD